MKTTFVRYGSLMLFLVMLQTTWCSGQVPYTVSETAAENVAGASNVEANNSFTLTYGMARPLLIEELGSPAFESIIPSMQRARVVYSDMTHFVFDKDSLVLVETVTPAKMNRDEGFAVVEAAGRDLRIDARLLAAKPQLLEPAEEHQLIRDKAFFFASGAPANLAQGINFSPVMSGCLLGPARCTASGFCPGYPQNGFHQSGGGDAISRLMEIIRRDVCHVCP